MRSLFSVTVHTPIGRYSYLAIGPDSTTVHLSAIDHFGLCGVSVHPVRKFQ
jgi:hypothetical protein